MSEQTNGAVVSATDDFKRAAFMAGLSIANFGMVVLNDNSAFSLVSVCVAGGTGGVAVYRGLSGLAKLHGEARDAPHPGQPPKIQP